MRPKGKSESRVEAPEAQKNNLNRIIQRQFFPKIDVNATLLTSVFWKK